MGNGWIKLWIKLMKKISSMWLNITSLFLTMGAKTGGQGTLFINSMY